MTIKQHSEEWKISKQSRIGGSEIYSLVHYYCSKELEQLGIDLIKEQPFQTALELFLKVKFNLRGDPISQVNSEYGLGMEEYILSRLRQESSLQFEGSKDFIINEELHPLACCSPDGSIKASEPFNVRDFDNKVDITEERGVGMLEIKTTPYQFNFTAEEGTRFQYIFQLMYNALVCGNKWGMLACLTPKEKEGDSDFFKGKVLGKIQTIDKLQYEIKSDLLDLELLEFYNLYTYIYPTIKPIQDLCLIALKRFQVALDKNTLPNISKDNEAKLIREKKLLAQIHPDRFGSMVASNELDNLLKERAIINTEIKKINTEKEINNCELIKSMKDHIEVVGTEAKAKFDTRGTLRISKIK